MCQIVFPDWCYSRLFGAKSVEVEFKEDKPSRIRLWTTTVMYNVYGICTVNQETCPFPSSTCSHSKKAYSPNPVFEIRFKNFSGKRRRRRDGQVVPSARFRANDLIG